MNLPAHGTTSPEPSLHHSLLLLLHGAHTRASRRYTSSEILLVLAPQSDLTYNIMYTEASTYISIDLGEVHSNSVPLYNSRRHTSNFPIPLFKLPSSPITLL